MTFAIITHVCHGKAGNYFAYSPYVAEMNIWTKYIDKVILVAPFDDHKKSQIDREYSFSTIDFRKVANFDLLGFRHIFIALVQLPRIFFTVFNAMRAADHIHLRCPGNIGLLGCVAQIFFPRKRKTAKYAGNWDFKSSQPWSYRLQRWILNNTFLTRNMQVLVYGEWPESSHNCKAFFTASYAASEITPFFYKPLDRKKRFVFAGSLVQGKNPMYAVEVVASLYKKGHNVSLELFGEGSEWRKIEDFISKQNLHDIIILHGNKEREILKQAFTESHFVILPSDSEGWPKAVAEGMFWGCVPVATPVSCVPFMLDFGARGILLLKDSTDLDKLEIILQDQARFQEMSSASATWSRRFTTDLFESEIKKMLV